MSSEICIHELPAFLWTEYRVHRIRFPGFILYLSVAVDIERYVGYWCMFVHRRLEGHAFILKCNTLRTGGIESSGVNEHYLSSSRGWTRRHNCSQLQKPPISGHFDKQEASAIDVLTEAVDSFSLTRSTYHVLPATVKPFVLSPFHIVTISCRQWPFFEKSRLPRLLASLELSTLSWEQF